MNWFHFMLSGVKCMGAWNLLNNRGEPWNTG